MNMFLFGKSTFHILVSLILAKAIQTFQLIIIVSWNTARVSWLLTDYHVGRVI